MCSLIPIHSSRGAFMRRLVGGERERHLRAEDLRNLRPRAVLGQPRRPLSSRPGPTTVKGIKAKMPRWRAARRGCTAVHHGPAAAGHRPEQSGQSALSARRPPRLRGKRKTAMRAPPWPKAHEQGTISHVLLLRLLLRPRVALFEQNPLCGEASIMVLIAAPPLPFPSR